MVAHRTGAGGRWCRADHPGLLRRRKHVPGRGGGTGMPLRWGARPGGSYRLEAPGAGAAAHPAIAGTPDPAGAGGGRGRLRAGDGRLRGLSGGHMTHGLQGDPGAQPQRTILSWHRTVLAVTVGALVASMTAQRLGHPLLAAIAALAGFVLLAGALYRLRYWHPRAARWAVLRQAAVAVIVLSLIGTSLAIVSFLATLSP